MIIHDAATLFVLIIDRAITAVETLAAAAAFVLCVVGFCLAPLIAPTARAVRRTARPEPRRRPVPSWAHTEPYDYDEAA
ncbi:hypothetical protein [Streptomyces sp. NPDC020298]|uniref:hypothetical protein n=1 Tax=unclassified Streptomyces TaxID=2593676 RepID=UPI0033F45BA8